VTQILIVTKILIVIGVLIGRSFIWPIKCVSNVALTVLFQLVKKQQTEQDGKLYRFLLLAGLLTGRNFDNDSNGNFISNSEPKKKPGFGSWPEF
jgi:hypothetical protein